MTTQDRWTPWPEHKNPTRQDRFASAPYNFVPLPEKVVSAVASADELPCHDEYRRGSHSGYFDVTLTTRSPLYIRGPLTSAEYQRLEQDPQLKNKPEFFHTGDALRPVIPGSSLRGMLRGLLEIVSYSKMQWVSEKQLFFRTVDDTAVGKQYRDRMGGHVETGFLMFRENEYVIQVCSMARVERFRAGKLLYDGVAPNLTPRWQGQREEPRQYAPVWVKIKPQTQGKKDAARPGSVETLSYQKHDGMREGRLVITGDIPKKKKKEFVFLLPEDGAERITVPNEIINRFHDDDQLTQWQGKAFPVDLPKQRYRERDGMLGRKPEAPGDPVLFLRENEQLTFIGRAQMFRLPYKQSPLALVDQSLRCAKQIDYAEALFGFVRTGQQLQEWDKEPPKQGEKGRAYAGRVIVTDAVLQSDPTDIWLTGGFEKPPIFPKILASPKPTSFQHYLTQRQPDDKFKLDHYDNRPSNGRLTTTIRGHKLYWHQGLGFDQGLDLEKIRRAIEDGFAQAEERLPDTQHHARMKPLAEPSPDTQHTRMKPLKPGVVFSFRVHFENLSERELGALCWALHPRGEAGRRYCHHLGMGKPLGMGAVELHARLHLIDRKQRYSTLFSGSTWQSGETTVRENSSERIRIPTETDEVSMGEDLALPDVLAHLTQPFEQHLLNKLKPDRPCTGLAGMKRIAMLLKLLEWPGYRAIESESTYLEKEKPPHPNTRYMTIQPNNEYRHRPVLPDPTAFDSAFFKNKAHPTEQARLRDSQSGPGPTSPARHPVPDPPAGDSDMQRAKKAVRSLEVMRESEVAGQIPDYHRQWQQLSSLDAREFLAQAILEKVRKARREKNSVDKAWYKELVAFLQSREGKG